MVRGMVRPGLIPKSVEPSPRIAVSSTTMNQAMIPNIIADAMAQALLGQSPGDHTGHGEIADSAAVPGDQG
ncbi:hypothetical protein [Sphingomonas parapaucimobilis]|uniref:hypothetical protein n=1 Tax=Sphingomonas parapaucimobilis TaxID=28213 RepID=UPI00321B9E1C